MTKNHILAEIRRTAGANGGKPLGRARFQEETGIREADWYGRYWATWGEALEKAGFLPNRLTQSFDEQHLLERYASLLLQLGRVPRSADLRLKRREDPAFPSHNTFARFGGKAHLLRRLRAFAATRPDRDALLSILGPEEQFSDSGLATPAHPIETGFVYLIKSGRHYKIGRSNAVGRREYELAIQLPEKPKTIHIIRTDDPVGIEAYWHQRFAAKRVGGEWFALEAHEISAFRRRRFM